MDKLREKQVYLWLRQQTKPAKKWERLTVGVGILSGILTIIQAWLLAKIISVIVLNHLPFLALLNLVIPLFIVFFLKAAAQWLKSIYGFRTGKSVREYLRRAVLDKISQQGPATLDLFPSGHWVMLLQERIEKTQDFFSLYLPQLKLMAVLPLITMIVVFFQNWATGFIFLITAPLVPVFMIFVGNKAAESNRKNFQVLTRLSHHFFDRLRGLSTLRYLNRLNQERQTVSIVANRFRKQTMRVLRLAFLSSAVLEFFSSISIALTAVYLGMSYLGYLSFGSWEGAVSLFSGFFLLLLAPEFYQSFKDLGTFYHARAEAIGAAEPLMEYLRGSTLDVFSGEYPLERTDQITLEFRHVTVKSPGGAILLDDISFRLDSGEKIFLIGASGAGKSTLLKTVIGLFPYEGEIKINGQELKSLDKETYHKSISWLSQESHLVYGTINENITLGMASVEKGVLEKAMDQAFVSEFVNELPEGEETIPGENGCRLSMGQARRVALARALLRGGSLVLLDEPVANLDKETESKINSRLEDYVIRRTVIMATHRLGQLRKNDKVLLLADGKRVAFGTFDELKATSGPFRLLWREWEHVCQIEDGAGPGHGNTIKKGENKR